MFSPRGVLFLVCMGEVKSERFSLYAFKMPAAFNSSLIFLACAAIGASKQIFRLSAKVNFVHVATR